MRTTIRPHNRSVLLKVRQRGVVLIIALVMLMAITLAGLALFRQVGSSLLIAGNLAFRQSATIAADVGVEAARLWLISANTPAMLNTLEGRGSSATGYYSAWCYPNKALGQRCATTDNFDPSTFDWSDTSKSLEATGPSSGAGNTVRYVIHRLCATNGSTIEPVDTSVGTQACVLASTTCDNKGIGECFKISTQPYYRVTARVTGPRNTLSYVEVILY